MQIIKVLVIFFIQCAIALASTVSVSFKKQASDKVIDMLMANLNIFHNGRQSAASPCGSPIADPRDPSQIPTGPDELIFDLSLQFLNPDEILSLSQVKKKNKIKGAISRILYRFSPHFVFKEDWFNAIVHNILIENFPRNIKIDNPEIHDYTILMALKYGFRDFKKTKLPNYIRLAIISFFFETIIGKGTNVPVDNDFQLVHFLGEKIQEYNLPRSLQYFISVLEMEGHPGKRKGGFFYYMPTNRNFIQILNFLSTKPDREAMINFLEASEFPFGTNIRLLFSSLLKHRLDEPLGTRTEIQNLLRFSCNMKFYSKRLLNRAKSAEFYYFFLENYWTGTVFFDIYGGLPRNYNDVRWCHPNDPFVINAMDRPVPSNPQYLIDIHFPFIVQLKMARDHFRRFFGHIQIPQIYYNIKYEILEMLLLESLLPVDRTFFMREGPISLDVGFKSFEKKIFIFEHYIPKNDPFLPLVLFGKHVKYFKEQIQKLNLNVIYKFDQRNLNNPVRSDILYSIDDGIVWQESFIGFNMYQTYEDLICFDVLRGKTMSFIDILVALDIPELLDVYNASQESIISEES